MTTQQEETVIVQYQSYQIGSVESYHMLKRLFCIDEADIRCVGRKSPIGDYEVDEYIALLETARESEIKVETRGLEYAELYNAVVVPRGSYTLAWLAKEKNNPLIKKLLSAGAISNEELTMWACGTPAWQYLSEVLKEHEGRKMAKPAFSVHN